MTPIHIWSEATLCCLDYFPTWRSKSRYYMKTWHGSHVCFLEVPNLITILNDIPPSEPHQPIYILICSCSILHKLGSSCCEKVNIKLQKLTEIVLLLQGGLVLGLNWYVTWNLAARHWKCFFQCIVPFCFRENVLFIEGNRQQTFIWPFREY